MKPRPFDPMNHRQPCPEHGLTRCLTCHTVAGECSLGGCLAPATRHVEIFRPGQATPAERRAVCAGPVCALILRQTAAGAVRFTD